MAGSEVAETREKVRMADGSRPMLTGKTRDEASSSSKLVVIADAHELLRESMRSMLSHEPDLRVVDEARDGREAIELCRLHRPDLVLMEASMPSMTGLEATRTIKEEFPGTKVLIVSAYESVAFISEAVIAGAEGYVSKLAPLHELLEAVRGVLRGESQYAYGSG